MGKVSDGDTMSGIAGKFGLELAEIKELNPQITNEDKIAVNDAIRVTFGAGVPEHSGATCASYGSDCGSATIPAWPYPFAFPVWACNTQSCDCKSTHPFTGIKIDFCMPTFWTGKCSCFAASPEA